eukprot:m.75129 g.75129  ORF g.75129 m.75129 type:complete len:367 (-) comp24740_c0_seq3:246-1346(-)
MRDMRDRDKGRERDRMSSILSNSRFKISSAIEDFKFGPTWMNEAKPVEVEKPVTTYVIWGIPILLLLWRVSPLFYALQNPGSFDACKEFSRSNDECTFKIPKIIHQTYKTEVLPDHWKHSPEMWKATHPTWKYMFWTDEKNREFITKHYNWFLKQYDAYPNNIQRADAIRYFILYHYGGVYADFDVQPLRSIEPMLMGTECVVGETPNIGITNAFMAATLKSPFYFHVMTQLSVNAHPLAGALSRHWEILQSTGPTFLWKIYAQYTKKKSTENEPKQRVDVIPSYVWGKCLICDRVCVTQPGAYFQHAPGDSWHHWDSYIFTYVIMCHGAFFILLGVALVVMACVKSLATKRLAVYYSGMLVLLLL